MIFKTKHLLVITLISSKIFASDRDADQSKSTDCGVIAAHQFTSRNLREHYDSILVWYLDKLAVDKGIANHADLRNVADYINPTLNAGVANGPIVEVGVGNGRVVDWLMQQSKSLRYIGVELSPAQTERLKTKYEKNASVMIVNNNILDFKMNEKSPLVLWMWSGFLELNPSEKDLGIKTVSNLQSTGGRLIIDLPSVIAGEKIIFKDDGFVENPYIKEGYKPFYGHLISDTELKKMANKHGYTLEAFLPYEVEAKDDKGNKIKRLSLVFKRR